MLDADERSGHSVLIQGRAGTGGGVGEIVAGKYRVERVIGRGAMGVVMAAAHVDTGQRVAIKSLLPNVLGNADAHARFEREARAAGALKSEHVTRVIEVGRARDGAPYIVMELLEGRDLAAELHRRGGKLPFPEAVTFIVEACDAIAEAHALGIIHRDLKPSNLFIAQRASRPPSVKVLDFGISKDFGLGRAPVALTGTKDLIGSPLYMSPEQIRSPKSVDARSDEWSLAATLYELVAGKPPFDGKSIADLSAKVMLEPAPDVRTHDASLPAGLAGILQRALEKSPERRFASVEAFARALAEFTKPPPIAPSARESTRTLAMPASQSTPRSIAAASQSTPRSIAAASPSNRTLPLTPPPAQPTSDPRIVTDAPRVSLPPETPVHGFPWAVVGALVALVALVVGLLLFTR